MALKKKNPERPIIKGMFKEEALALMIMAAEPVISDVFEGFPLRGLHRTRCTERELDITASSSGNS